MITLAEAVESLYRIVVVEGKAQAGNRLHILANLSPGIS